MCKRQDFVGAWLALQGDDAVTGFCALIMMRRCKFSEASVPERVEAAILAVSSEDFLEVTHHHVPYVDDSHIHEQIRESIRNNLLKTLIEMRSCEEDEMACRLNRLLDRRRTPSHIPPRQVDWSRSTTVREDVQRAFELLTTFASHVDFSMNRPLGWYVMHFYDEKGGVMLSCEWLHELLKSKDAYKVLSALFHNGKLCAASDDDAEDVDEYILPTVQQYMERHGFLA